MIKLKLSSFQCNKLIYFYIAHCRQSTSSGCAECGGSAVQSVRLASQRVLVCNVSLHISTLQSFLLHIAHATDDRAHWASWLRRLLPRHSHSLLVCFPNLNSWNIEKTLEHNVTRARFRIRKRARHRLVPASVPAARRARCLRLQASGLRPRTCPTWHMYRVECARRGLQVQVNCLLLRLPSSLAMRIRIRIGRARALSLCLLLSSAMFNRSPHMFLCTASTSLTRGGTNYRSFAPARTASRRSPLLLALTLFCACVRRNHFGTVTCEGCKVLVE